MHQEVIDFVQGVKNNYPAYFHNSHVLEVGSLDLNGSVRPFFSDNKSYVGIDIGPGEGVDVVCAAHEYVRNGEFDVVISTEMLEHDMHWQKSLKQMYENLESGGLLIITCACTERAEHGTRKTSPLDSPYTNDYYRNISLTDLLTVLPIEELFSACEAKTERENKDLMFWGIKI